MSLATWPSPEQDLSRLPGAMRTRLERKLPAGGVVTFEWAPAGWLKQDGTPRLEDWRAYHYQPDPCCSACRGTGRAPSEKRPRGTIQCKACKGTGIGPRERMVSVTTLLDSISPKPGLPPWAEARGIEGAVQAMRMGEITTDTDPEDAVKLVRLLRLGADRARDDAASRGLDVHTLNETFALTGGAPRLDDHPSEHHGYIAAWASWLLERRPEAVVVEGLVCDPEAGYAGRRDFVATVGRARVGYDFKTSERAAIFSGAHVQLRLYERAAVACGDEPCDELVIVVFAADGQWREMPCAASESTAKAALEFYREVKPIDAECASWNRFERDARR